MKLNLGSLLIFVLLIAVLVLEFMQYQQARQQGLVSEKALAVVNEQLTSIDQRLLVAETSIKQLEGSSVDSLVKEANGAIIAGWQALINTVDEELERARQTLNSQSNSGSNPRNNDPWHHPQNPPQKTP